uniref:Uncharacterized protein n=1 Tax=viral metagenome TaxID=1070528 RepID=A0A6C0K425_9ZZZZ
MRKNKTKMRKIRKNKQTRKNRRMLGGNKVQCCICERRVSERNTLNPSACLMKNGSKAHRICSDCWWDSENGFAREGANHECPGCKKGLPLLKPKSASKVSEVVDLTLDS